MASPATAANPAGLEDVVAATSSICFLDGKQGRLLYRGYDIHDLAANASYEEVVYLLLHDDLPTKAQLDEQNARLVANREVPADVVKLLETLPKEKTHPMELLRTVVSALSAYDPDGFRDNSIPANVRKAERLIAQLPTLTAYIKRLRAGEPLVHPRKTGGIAENFLYMVFGREPDPKHTHTINVALILHADHELNASTFAARVTAATLSDMYSSVVSGIGALAGPLHGGANEEVMKMLLQIGDESKAESFILDLLKHRDDLRAQGKTAPTISGFGHRVYRTEDPRATHLRKMSEELGMLADQPKWFRMSRTIEETMKREKGLWCNVDFYSASTYYVMGIPTDLYTPFFACSRVSGWAAHVLEQLGNNRLIRPRAEYTGTTDRTYTQLAAR
ncbi:MAG: citrate synthase [Chloroflexi bacterium]|nr:citrate synthase [Chloroflexota bacterium]